MVEHLEHCDKSVSLTVSTRLEVVVQNLGSVSCAKEDDLQSCIGVFKNRVWAILNWGTEISSTRKGYEVVATDDAPTANESQKHNSQKRRKRSVHSKPASKEGGDKTKMPKLALSVLCKDTRAAWQCIQFQIRDGYLHGKKLILVPALTSLWEIVERKCRGKFRLKHGSSDRSFMVDPLSLWEIVERKCRGKFRLKHGSSDRSFMVDPLSLWEIVERKCRGKFRLKHGSSDRSFMVDPLSLWEIVEHKCRGKFRLKSSSVVRAFAHGVMGRRIDPSW